MALVKCKECGNQISKSAKACPACGAPVKKGVGLIGWIFAIIVVLPIAWQFGKSTGKVEPVTSTTSTTSVAPHQEQLTPPAPAETWSISEFKDAMTDETIKVVSSESKNSTIFEFPYNQAGGSRLTLSFRGQGNELDAVLRIDKGQMQCSYSKCGFSLRVADGDAQRWTGVQSSTNDSDLMFVRDARQLEEIVKSGSPLRIGIEFYRAGERVFEFDPAGYPGI